MDKNNINKKNYICTSMRYVKKLARIYDGWKNFIFLSPTIEELAKVRANICAACPYAVYSFWTQAIGDNLQEIKGLKCDKCNCPISAKVRSVKEECGDQKNPKW
jgi:hypothetical protein